MTRSRLVGPSHPPGTRLVLGLQPVREALRVHGGRVELVWVEIQATSNPRIDAVARFARDQSVARIERVPRSDLDRVAGGTRHQGVAAFAPPLPLLEGRALALESGLLAVALDGIQDPQNFGAVIRSAVGVARAAVVWGEHGSAPLSPTTFRASAGAIEHARLCRVESLVGWLQEAQGMGAQVIGLDPQAERSLREVDLRAATILVVGSEDRGLQRNTRRHCSDLVRLVPTLGVGSLNAAAATAIALYEAAIQRVKTVG